MTTNFELNQQLEKYLEHIHVKMGQARKLVENARPNSIPVQLTNKLDFLDIKLNSLKTLAKSKERWQ